MFEPAFSGDQLGAVRRLELAGARLYVQQSWALLELWDSAAAARVGAWVDEHDHQLAEAASLLRLSPQSISARLAVAEVLREHPLLPALMQTGALGVAHLLAAVDEIGALGDEALAERVLSQVLTGGAQPGWDGTPAELRRDALLGALIARAGTAVDLELQLNVPVTVTSTTPTTPTCPPEPVTITADLTPELLAMLTGTPAPAEPAAAEPVAPAPAEPAAAEPVAAERVLTEPTARRSRIGGVPELLDHGPLDPQLLRDLLADPAGLPIGLGRVTIRRVCIDETGQPVAIDDTAVPLARLLAPPGRRSRAPRPATTSPSAAPPERPAAAGPLARLRAHLPAPPPRTNAYVPTAAQQRLVRARDTTCTFPGCARRFRRCEIDHRQPHSAGGPTSVINEQPVCKHHHRLKHDGWTCTRQGDGSTLWTSPRGQTHTAPRR